MEINKETFICIACDKKAEYLQAAGPFCEDHYNPHKALVSGCIKTHGEFEIHIDDTKIKY